MPEFLAGIFQPEAYICERIKKKDVLGFISYHKINTSLIESEDLIRGHNRPADEKIIYTLIQCLILSGKISLSFKFGGMGKHVYLVLTDINRWHKKKQITLLVSSCW
jgi:hypothetical protein